MFDRILVVCVGNICRSPVAQSLLRDHRPRKDIQSAGIGALVGEPADPAYVTLLRERGLDLSGHRARQLDESLLRDSDLLLVMEAAHQHWIESRWPQARGRVYRWGHWSGFDVPDPYGRDEAVFKEVLQMIERGVTDWTARIPG